MLATGTVTTLAGSVDGPSGSVDGVGSLAGFSGPWGIVHDGRDTLYISEATGSIIRKLVLTTGAVTTIAGSAAEPGFRDGTSASARFSGPQGIVLDGTDTLLIADTGNGAIRRLIPATGEVTTVDKVRFFHPVGLANDGKGKLYGVDDSDMSLQRLVLATGEVFRVAGVPQECAADDGTGTTARFCQPAGIALDGAGNVLIADSINQVIREVELATRAVTTIAGASRQAGAADGSGAQARFVFQSWNAGLASDGRGNLFVADANNSVLRKIVVATAEVTTFAGSLRERGMVDGIGKNARFALPTSLAFDGIGSLYVADVANQSIRKVALDSGTVTTLVGSPRRRGVFPGPLPASLGGPLGLLFVTPATLFITDVENAVLRAQL